MSSSQPSESIGPLGPLEPPIYDSGEPAWKIRYNELRKKLVRVGEIVLETYTRLSVWKKILLIIATVCSTSSIVVLIIYHNAILEFIARQSDVWAENPWSPVILIIALFIISFPPMIGYSLTGSTIGALYGVTFKGWLIMAVGSISGSVAAFILFRYVLKERSKALVHSNKTLMALSSVLKDRGSYWLLTLIRLCPFPYSLTNGALAGIHGVTIWNFFLGSFFSSPKLLLYLFIGAKLKDIGKTKDPKTRFIDFMAMLAAGLFLILTGWLLYRKVSQRLEEFEQLEASDLNESDLELDDSAVRDDDSLLFDEL